MIALQYGAIKEARSVTNYQNPMRNRVSNILPRFFPEQSHMGFPDAFSVLCDIFKQL